MTATREQRDLIADVVEAWFENLYEDYRAAPDDARDDAVEMFDDHAPGAVEALRYDGPLALDTGNWRAIEDALYGYVMDVVVYVYDLDLSATQVREAAAALGITPEYFEGPGPKKGDQ